MSTRYTALVASVNLYGPSVMARFFTSDKEGGNAFICLSVCLLARLLKNACMDLDEMLRVDRCRDINELIIEPDLDYSPDAGTGLLSPLSYKRCYEEFYVRKIRRIRMAAAVRRGFTMVLVTEPVSRQNTFVGGTCASPSALLVCS